MINEAKAEEVAACIAQLGLSRLANWIPPDFHDEIRELLETLVIAGIEAHDEAPWAGVPIPDPSLN